MFSIKKAESIMGWILTLGTVVSALLVLIGGLFYLLQNGGESVQAELSSAHAFTNLESIFHAFVAFSPRGVIALGVMTLVATQLLRVGLLVWFYVVIRDYFFTAICLFVLIILLYSGAYPH